MEIALMYRRLDSKLKYELKFLTNEPQNCA
jgi:hypothetical protein